MSDKKYWFELTENQVKLIKKSISFTVRECSEFDDEEYEESLQLSKDIYRQIGFYQGMEKQRKLKDD